MSEPALPDSNAARKTAFPRSMERFSYALSHELRNPLISVKASCYLLTSEFRHQLGSAAAEYLNLVSEGASRIGELVNKTLSYLRLDTANICFELVDCQEICEKALHLKPAIEESGATLAYESLPKVMGDAIRLRQLFENLVVNAIKFRGGNPPHIHVSARQNEQEWEITVRDNGIGIDPKDFDRIFRPFQRLHAGNERAGMGIGLAMCKRIVEQHGGRIWVESAPCQGSTFHFTIPSIDAPSSRGTTSLATASQSELPANPQFVFDEVIAGLLRQIEARLAAFNTPLEALQRTLALDNPEARKYADLIRINLAHANDLIRVWVQFAGLAQSKLACTEVAALLNALGVLLEPYLRALGIRLEIECQENLRVNADEDQLKQVLNELVQNAADNLQAGGKITIRGRTGDLRGLPAQAVLLEVEDTGSGIPLELRVRLGSEPFLSTKPGHAGLGLYRSARIIENQGGILNFESHAGKGTTFRIALPAETTP